MNIEALHEKVRQQSTAQILDCIRMINTVIQKKREGTTEEVMVRASLLTVYGEREGEDAEDKLMDELGM